MSDGSRIKEEMDKRGVSIQEVAHAAGISWTAVSKWLKRDELGPDARVRASSALGKVGIDPRSIWPTAIISDGTVAPSKIDELKPLLRGFTDEQLRAVRRLLEADRADQVTIVNIIEGMLFRDSGK